MDDPNNGMATLDKVLKEADEIFDKFLNAKINYLDNKMLDKFYAAIKKDHHDFFCVYWFVVKAMIYMGMYDKRALKKYLIKVSKMNKDKEEAMSLSEKIEMDAEYVAYVYKEKTAHYSVKTANKMKQEFADSMKKELKDYKKEVKEVSEKVEEKYEHYETERIAEKRKALLNLIKVNKDNIKPSSD